MPKEITHWTLCARTHGAMPPSALRGEMARHPHAYLLGAMLYDTPMFSKFLGDGSAFEGVSERMHGAGGEDTVEPVRAFLEGLPGAMDGRTLALTAGLLTHVGIDSQFHPMVYHMTGNYYDADPEARSLAVVRHRRFEVAMDLHFMSRGLPRNGGYYWNSLRGSGFGRGRLHSLLTRLWLSESRGHPDVPRLLRWHSAVQYLIRQRWAALGAKVLGPALDERWQETVATFYPPAGRREPSWCARPIAYANPVTGEARTETLAGMEERAVAMNLRLLSLLAGARGDPREAASALREVRGPSLETGIAGSRADEMRHFRARADGRARRAGADG